MIYVRPRDRRQGTQEEIPSSDLVRASTGRLRGSPGLCHSGQFSSAGRPEALPAS